MGDRGAAAGGHDAPSAPVSSASLADAFHELVHLHVAAGGFVHGALHFGKRLEPVMMVKVPRALMTGRTPMDR